VAGEAELSSLSTDVGVMMKKLLIAVCLVVVLYYAFVPRVGASTYGEPYWSCHTEQKWVWVGWPTFFERHTVTVCEVKEY
jgi:hypothetical protein